MGEFTNKQIEIYQREKVALYRRTHPEARDLAYEALADMFVITPEELIIMKAEEAVRLKSELAETRSELESDERELSSGDTEGMALTELYRDIANGKIKLSSLEAQLKGVLEVIAKLKEENPSLENNESYGR